MWPRKPWQPAPKPLTRGIRGAAMAALWLSVLPLLLGLPPMVAGVLVVVPGAVCLLAFYRPMGRLLVASLLVGVSMLVLAVQSGGGDWRATGLGLLVAAVLMKGAEMRTTRDGFSTVGFFVLIGPFVAFAMEMGGLATVVVAGASLAMAMCLAGMMSELQDGLPVRRWRPHLGEVGRMAGLALPLALAVFWLVPRLDSPLWGLTAPQSRTGIDGSMSPGDIGRLMKDPSTAFRVRFQGQAPGKADLYWRGLTMDHFDGRAWTSVGPELPVATTASAPRAAPGAATWRYELSMEPTRQRYLFALDWPVGPAPEGAMLLKDRSLRSIQALEGFTRWQGLASSPHPRPVEALDAGQRAAMVQLPEAFNPQAVALGRAWREEGLSDQAIVRRALGLFASGFRYSLHPPLLGRHSVDEFLFQTKVGFCEHYSSAFAVLMRAAGIPTRVVAGYQGGVPNGFGDYWRVRQADAHAWDEVWLEGQGWVRVDPTAAIGGPREIDASPREQALVAVGIGSGLADWVRQGWSVAFQDFDARRQREILQAVGLGGLPTWAAGLLGLAMLGGVFVALAMVMRRERRGRLPPELTAWRQMVLRLERAGWAPRRHETPLALTRRVALALSDPDLAAQWRAAGEAFCRWRYQGLVEPGLAARLRQLKPPRPAPGPGARK